MFVVGMFAGRLARQLGGKVLVIAGCLIGSVAMAILAFAHAHTWEIYLSTAIMGVGFGLAFSAMSALVVAAVPAEQTGVASGMNANIRTIGGSIGAALMASIVTAQLGPPGCPGVRLHDRVRGDGRRPLLAALAGLLVPASRGVARQAGDRGTGDGDGRRRYGRRRRERVTGPGAGCGRAASGRSE